MAIEWGRIRPGYVKPRGALVQPDVVDEEEPFVEILHRLRIPYRRDGELYWVYGYASDPTGIRIVKFSCGARFGRHRFLRGSMIRSFETSDMTQVLGIWLQASIKAHHFVAKEFWESKVAEMRDIYLPASETYVHGREGAIQGFISLYGDTLAAIFVAPGVQGEGIGSQLMGKAKQVRQSLTLTVYKGNKNSIGFYERCGFEIVEEQIGKHTGHAELVMTFNL